MRFKKRIPVRALLRVSFVILMFFGVPLWMFMIAMITESALLWLFLLCWLLVSYSIAWRVENG